MIIAFTGAGISKESGIDTFSDNPGIRDKLTRDFADKHPKEYREVIRQMKNTIENKEPNDAHKALAEYNVPIITMNIDKLHEKAGSTQIIKIHGELPEDDEIGHCDLLYGKPALYGDLVDYYANAYKLVDTLGNGDILLVIGASTHTTVSNYIRDNARNNGAEVVEINEEASDNVRKFLAEHGDKVEKLDIEKILGEYDDYFDDLYDGVEDTEIDF